MRRLLSALVLLLAGLSPAMAQPFPATGVPTYYGSVLDYSVPANATDIACLEGAAGKVVKLNGAFISGTALTAASINVTTMRRISLNVGGTSNEINPTSGNPTHGAALAKLKFWTVSPATLGNTDVPPKGIVFRRLRWDIGAALSSPDASLAMIASQANNPYTSQPEIRSATNAICIGFGGTGSPAALININVVWTETDS